MASAPANCIYVINNWEHVNNPEKKIRSLLQLREQAKASHGNDLGAEFTYYVDFGSRVIPNCIETKGTVQNFIDRCNGMIAIANGTMK